MGSRRRTTPRRRAAALGASILLALAPAFAAPAAMAAGLEEGAFNELKSKAQQETTPTRTHTSTASTESTSSSNSNSGTLIVLATGVAIVLLVGIGYFIFRDARKVAPAGDGQLAEVTGARRSATRLQKRRAQAKAARRQRKRNR